MNSNPTIGFDLSAAKMTAYNECRDPTGEVSIDNLRAAVKLGCTSDPRRLASADFSLFRSKLRPMTRASTTPSQPSPEVNRLWRPCQNQK